MGARAMVMALWLLAAVLLGATVWPFAAGGPVGLAGNAARPVAPVLPPSLADLALPPVESFAETLARPLFTATRRPPSPGELLQGQEMKSSSVLPAGKGDTVILGKYILRGVVVTPDQKLLLLKRQDTGALMRLKEGDSLDDWRIAAIAQDHLMLSKGSQQERVSLREKP